LRWWWEVAEGARAGKTLGARGELGVWSLGRRGEVEGWVRDELRMVVVVVVEY